VEVTVGVTVTDATLFATEEVYDVVPAANATFSEPSLSTSALSVLTVLSAAALLTVTVYVVVVIVSRAVTTTEIAVVDPAVRACVPDALPDVTALPPTVTVAAASVVVGVNLIDATPFTTVAVYAVVAAASAGARVPALKVRILSVASVEPVDLLLTVTAYVFVVVPSPAVTTTLIAAFAPTEIACPPDAEPDMVDDPPTVTKAPLSLFVGVMVMEDIAFSTVVVYAVVLDANAGVSVPELSTKLSRFASVFPDAVLVTATLYDVVVDVPS
jgi:hypothetical protein